MRAGYAIPFGQGDAVFRMRDLVSPQVVPQLELAYRVRQLLVGGYVSYGFGSVSGTTRENCDDAGQRCSSTSLRVGGLLRWAFAGRLAGGEPWIGAGIGYDGVTVRRPTTRFTYMGSEWLVLEAGVDWPTGGEGTLGAFAGASYGVYTVQEGGGNAGAIDDRRGHEWLTVGVRGTYSFWRRR